MAAEHQFWLDFIRFRRSLSGTDPAPGSGCLDYLNKGGEFVCQLKVNRESSERQRQLKRHLHWTRRPTSASSSSRTHQILSDSIKKKAEGSCLLWVFRSRRAGLLPFFADLLQALHQNLVHFLLDEVLRGLSFQLHGDLVQSFLDFLHSVLQFFVCDR